jgi:hypothetical protein
MANGLMRVTEQDARALPRFEFIARYLEVFTRKKVDRDLVGGKQVRRHGGKWQVLYRNGLVEYETPGADRLFDYVRRGPLNYFVRQAEEFRGLAHERGARKLRGAERGVRGHAYKKKLDAEIVAALGKRSAW